MGFRRDAARVADPSLGTGRRIQALAWCIESTQPIGFHATWVYLESRTGMASRDPEFVEPALDLLRRQRVLYLEAEAEYTEIRRDEKRAGRRSPADDQVTPRAPRRWHGDERHGASIALRTSLANDRRHDQISNVQPARLTLAHAREAAHGQAESLDHADLQLSLDWCRYRLRTGRHDDGVYGEAWRSLWLLGQIYVMLTGASAVGAPWNFSPRDASH